jgi:dolichol-phosphate mannosyltransferase
VPELTVVVPMRNEVATSAELVARVQHALADVDARVLVADDQSQDGTPDVARDAGAEVLSLPHRHGQLGATLAGLAHTSSPWVAVLDGDLQDPPETLAPMWRARTGVDVVFAVKTRRGESRRFQLARAAYGLALTAIRARLPANAGSYALFTRRVADEVVAFGVPEANLAVLLAATRSRSTTVPYEKAARPHGHSRVGAVGLAQEALTSLALASPPGVAWLRRTRSPR